MYSAQSHIEKLLEYIKDISQSDKRMYSKSIKRLQDISNSCKYVVDMISSILKDQMFEDSDDEFAGLEDSKLNSVVREIRSDIQSIPSTDSKIPIQSSVSPQDKRKAFILYTEILKQVSECNFEIPAASNCAKLLWYWFDCRFISSKEYCPNFRYSMFQLPIWIRNIVIGYGYSIQQDTEESFTDNFRYWCDSIKSDSSVNYPLPYDIYNISNEPKEYINLTSVVLWDILLDYGYITLCNRLPEKLYLKEDIIYEFSGEINPGVLDMYSNYQSYPEILQICKLSEV